MAEITFDPELMQHIKTIYGDADLSDKTLQLLYNTWKANPDWIRNTALQKARIQAPLTLAGVAVLSTPLQATINSVNEIANDDLSGVSDFNTAFGEANKRGLKVFKWKSTKANPSGLFGTQYANTSNSINLRPLPKPEDHSQVPLKNMLGDLKPGNEYINYKIYHSKYPLAEHTFSWDPNVSPPPKEQINIYRKRAAKSPYGEEGLDFTDNRGFSIGEILGNRYGYTQKKQQGGTMNNQEELQKAFIAYLIQDAAAQGIQLLSEQDLLAYAQLLGEEGIQAKYQEFILRMQGGVKARLGAKLEYYRKLKGVCPDGSQPTYFKEGGFFKKGCSACQKAKKGIEINSVQEFKNKRKHINENDTIHADNKVYDLTGKHKQYPKLTNDKYRKLSDRKQSDVDLKDQARKNACGAKMKKK